MTARTYRLVEKQDLSYQSKPDSDVCYDDLRESEIFQPLLLGRFKFCSHCFIRDVNHALLSHSILKAHKNQARKRTNNHVDGCCSDGEPGNEHF